ncbi:hypothetical protein IMZ31_23840 (plasmid) [Pontibacillus sp. ALD_SL1]|uniref:LPD11 domain-containing protein n=1 Tax=Pontibacillus sp. ALD_SL1 TaxID=2777185 RepID=UPI001A95B799|nr:LPD11 domain-containing protein [Pontibacillus sp. ALD_SL1]QST02485.1 hypothetical protein IMZ31_23840 [Pontibacillus sp. ALD_SL1]
MENTQKRTMEYVGEDDWSRPVYKCAETGRLYKDLSDSDGRRPELYTCGNAMDGEPDSPLSKELNFRFTGTPKPINRGDRFNYSLLSRLKMDCDYYLGNGGRHPKHLWAGNEQDQIQKMKELHNSFSHDKKPEWLTYEEILQYEDAMVNDQPTQ